MERAFPRTGDYPLWTQTMATGMSSKPETINTLAIKPAKLTNKKRAEEIKLLKKIRANLASLEKLLYECGYYEDLMYRFYHQSFKVYAIQELTKQIVTKLHSLAPRLPMNSWFMEIVKPETGREFALSDNREWTKITRPMLEAFFHAHYFLEMVCKFGKELESPPEVLPSGWAAVLYLYNLR